MRELLCAILRGDVIRWPFASADAESLFLNAASVHGVRPLLAFHLRQAGILNGWPAGICQALDRAAVQGAIVEQLLQHETARVLTALATAGVRPLIIKGAGLAYTHYPDASLRPRCDTDLLMHKKDIPVARRMMQDLGYAQDTQITGQLLTSQCLYAKHDRHGLQHAFDLHWAVANPRLFASILTMEEAEPLTIDVPALGNHARSLGAVHALLLACVHRVAHHNDSDMLIWIYDIHLLASCLTELDAAEFVRLAAAKRVQAICAGGLVLARESFNTEMPADLLAALGRGNSEPSAAYLGGRVRNVDVLLSDLKTMAGWGRRLELLRQHVFPPAAYMLQRYGMAGRRHVPIVLTILLPLVLPILYADRFVRGMPRWFRPLERPAP